MSVTCLVIWNDMIVVIEMGLAFPGYVLSCYIDPLACEPSCNAIV